MSAQGIEDIWESPEDEPKDGAETGTDPQVQDPDTEATEEVEATIVEDDAEEPAGEGAEDQAEQASDSELVAAAQAEAKDWQDKFMRLHAEWDTYRRRMNEEREEEKHRATEKLVESLLPVVDDFERTIDYATKNGEEGLLDGVAAVHTKFVDILGKDGVEVIDPAGAAFDALEHQAVGTVEDTTVPDETVAQVYQKGYRMGGKVIRPAMVTVSSGGPKREVPEDEEQ